MASLRQRRVVRGMQECNGMKENLEEEKTNSIENNIKSNCKRENCRG